LVRTAARLALAAGLLFPAPALACRLALLLALDVSSSVDAREYLLQKNGLAAALIAPEVEAAFLSASEPVALAAYEWSGRYNHQTVLDWRLISSREDLVSAAEALAVATRSEDEFPTALGYALGHAARLFRQAPTCERRVIDVSGDGRNNDGFSPRIAYRHFPLDDVTVNALVIGGSQDLDDLVAYFRADVLHGPGAFVETAYDYADFERAMRRKLEREVAARALSALDIPR
jgi:Protein of unknown function (DUF1194)